MKLSDPVQITPRLMAGLRIGKDSWVSIEYSNKPDPEGRQRYFYAIDAKEQSHEAEDLRSGVGGGSLWFGLTCLLTYLSAAGEAYRYRMKDIPSDNENLFPDWVEEWCYQNDGELAEASMLLEENKNAIDEGS